MQNWKSHVKKKHFFVVCVCVRELIICQKEDIIQDGSKVWGKYFQDQVINPIKKDMCVQDQ